jgi:hypothetical protein
MVELWSPSALRERPPVELRVYIVPGWGSKGRSGNYFHELAVWPDVEGNVVEMEGAMEEADYLRHFAGTSLG